jgi:beta-mannosidase
VDSDERPKPLYYALKHAFAPRLLTVQPRQGRPTLVVINDRDHPWTETVHATRQTFAGETLATAQLRLRVTPRSTALLDLADDLLEPADPSSEVLVATAGGAHTHHLFGEDRELRYVRDLALLADKVAADAVVDDVLISLTAGETHHFTVRTAERLAEPSTLLRPSVLCCANTLASPAS